MKTLSGSGGAGNEGSRWAPVMGEVQDGDTVPANSAAACRILLHTSFRPAPVFAEKGITVAVG